MSELRAPISVIIATRHRARVLKRTLETLAAQHPLPAETLVIDSSENSESAEACRELDSSFQGALRHVPASTRGAASQRNEGATLATQSFLLFCDDDIIFEPDCLAALLSATKSDGGLGGVNALITNQTFHPLGRMTRFIVRLLGARANEDLAGRVVGPAVTFRPADRASLPEAMPVQWLGSTCVMYRREALPTPPFPAHFHGYSMCEDLALSLEVGKRWRLATVRTARIFHDSQPGDHKSNRIVVARMELMNRHYVMTKVLGRSGVVDHLRLLLWESFNMFAAVRMTGDWRGAGQRLRGKASGMLAIMRGKGS